MNAFINVLFIFVLMYIALLIKIPNVNNSNFIYHKFVIFVLLFGYQYALLVISKIKNKCKIDLADIFRHSIETSAAGIIGYSIFVDMQYYKTTNGDILFAADPKIRYLYASISIALAPLCINMIKLMFDYKPYECANYE